MIDTICTLEAREGLARLADGSVDCVLTSPPYWACRDYGVAPTKWADGSVSALGLEADLEGYLDHLVEVFDQVRRVLKDSGSLWVNLADVYAGAWGISPPPAEVESQAAQAGAHGWNHPANPRRGRGRRVRFPVPEKSLCLIPERFALRMVERGWVLRNVIVWAKSNFLPASVKDRFACGHERVFLFVKSSRYYFGLDAVRAPHADSSRARTAPHRTFRHFKGERWVSDLGRHRLLHPKGKNPGDVWAIPTSASFGGHPAVFPERLCERPILAGCPPGGLVLDPFAGSGTTCVVARRLGRRFIGFEASAQYAELARLRLIASGPGASSSSPEGGERAA